MMRDELRKRQAQILAAVKAQAIDLNADFHALPSLQVFGLIAVADQFNYKQKPYTNASRGRSFYEYVQTLNARKCEVDGCGHMKLPGFIKGRGFCSTHWSERCFAVRHRTAEDIIADLAPLPLARALWWFIEEMNDEDPHRQTVFFALRERVRTEAM